MHLGNARTALLAWLQARAARGEAWLRMEDLDRARCRPELAEGILQDLKYLGLDWDAPPVYQSQRNAAYEAALARLETAGRLYPCFCTRAEIAHAASAPHGPSDDGPRYPGTCRGLSSEARAVRARTRTPALRFIPEPGVTRFDDGIAGPQAQDVSEAVGDFVVRRNDGVASYQLAVVVDDAESEITDVLRADDLLGSTARQLQLFSALGLAPPRYAHVPLVLGEDGKRLAKREGVFALSELRERGVASENVLGLLAQWSGLGDGGPTSAAALVSQFELGRIPGKPVVVQQADIEARLG
jgi:glutamyl-tRNA synthetase